jgi:hypothetical protein
MINLLIILTNLFRPTEVKINHRQIIFNIPDYSMIHNASGCLYIESSSSDRFQSGIFEAILSGWTVILLRIIKLRNWSQKPRTEKLSLVRKPALTKQSVVFHK